jgi:hypothetical protein
VIFQGNTRLVHDHLKKTKKGLTMNEIAAHTGIEKKSVKSAINRLDEYGLLARIGKKGACTVYQYSMSPKLTQPNASKGYERKAVTPFGKPVNAPHKPGTVNGHYLGLELAAYEGRPGANDAFNCPSIVNGVAVERVRPQIICAGARNWGPMNVGRPSRLA